VPKFGLPTYRAACAALFLLLPVRLSAAAAPSPGTAGALVGAVTDAAGAPAPAAAVELKSASPGFSRHTQSGPDGTFLINNIPPGAYTLRVSLAGFQPHIAEVAIRGAAPVHVRVRLELAVEQASVTVEAAPGNLPENNPAASNILDRRFLALLPAASPDSALNDAILYTTAGVAADSNGFFHPLGDHAQVSYVIDGQPVSDQRNKVFSISIPANAVQSMEVISGSPPAEYGDKTSLVINTTTRSGLGQKPTGSFLAGYGSFGAIREETALAAGTARWGNFVLWNLERTGRFLDTPEFRPIHDIGNAGTLFDRIDFQPGGNSALHVNLMAGRNWLQVPNTYDQPRQDQKQKAVSFNAAAGYQRTLHPGALLSLNVFLRGDRVSYYPSRDPFDDSPATLAQYRTLSNFGMRSDLAGAKGRHNWKTGLSAGQTRLHENFSLGVTDPGYNAPCASGGGPVALPELRDPSQCAASGFQLNDGFLSGLLPYDLTRGGNLYRFAQKANIHQLAFFGSDSVTLGNLTLNLGLRFDRYDGLTHGSGVQPRGAFSYLVALTKTVIRGGYSRTMETPTNENLVVSSSTGPGGLAGNLFQGTVEQRPIALGRRNQYDAGVQQSIGGLALLDVSYFRKYTRNAFDFDALFSTPVAFPIAWKQSKLDGVAARISTAEIHNLRLYATMGHANARFFGPENGGIIFNSKLAAGAYRQDHDQVYQQNVNVRYQKEKNGWWADFLWRYDSGLVIGAVKSLQDALALTAAQQSAIGLYCGAERASPSHRIASCDSPLYGADRIRIPAPGTENDDHNPPRARSRHIFSIGIGTDDLFHAEQVRTIVRFTVVNLSNQAALYNFLSPFSGTHWVAPRTFQAEIGWAF
jgi:hypothetical protein